MKLLANRNIRLLFCQVLLLLTASILLSAVFIGLRLDNAAQYILICTLWMGILIVAAGYRYFKKQNNMMEHAVTQIRDYISGNQSARIDCGEEGELYRLFHEVNSLVSILNANAEQGKTTKKFLKETISDISHQLKTPLAALNVYNGIIREEAKDIPIINEFTELTEQELERVGILVKNLLTITKLDAGTIVMENTQRMCRKCWVISSGTFYIVPSRSKKGCIFPAVTPSHYFVTVIG